MSEPAHPDRGRTPTDGPPPSPTRDRGPEDRPGDDADRLDHLSREDLLRDELAVAEDHPLPVEPPPVDAAPDQPQAMPSIETQPLDGTPLDVAATPDLGDIDLPPDMVV